MKDITIRKKFNGFEVSVGCKDLVFETRTKLFKELSRYIANPDEVEREYLERYGEDKAQILSTSISFMDLDGDILSGTVSTR